MSINDLSGELRINYTDEQIVHICCQSDHSVLTLCDADCGNFIITF